MTLRTKSGLLRAAGVALAVLLGGCSRGVEVRLPRVSVPPASTVFRAGAAEADITPPPGAPLFGYAVLSAAPHANGYRTRLKARALVLEGPKGGRIALVQADLGATSRLLHQRVAEQMAALGFGPDRILLSATHTHAGPGGYFENAFYNDFGAGKPGFDEALTAWLTERIATAIREATARLQPSTIGVATVHLPFVTHNRSIEAWGQNACPGCPGERAEPVDDRLRLIRIDRATPEGNQPLAAFAVFAIHSTAVSKENDLYHGDVHGYAARHFEALVERAYPGVSPFVGAIVNGAEGDVAPTKPRQGFAQAELLGRAVGQGAFRAYVEAERSMSPAVDLAHGFRDVVLPGAPTSRGPVCREAMIGVPTLAGAEDGPSGLRGHFGIFEGRRKDAPEGCHASKEAALGMTQRLVLREALPHASSVPTVGSFGVVALYPSGVSEHEPLFALATYPGEPTTAVGFDTTRRVATALGVTCAASAGASAAPPDVSSCTDRVAVVGLTNGYLGYFTSTAEYAAQHYEGGSTFFGPLQSVLATEQLEAVAAHVRDHQRAREQGVTDRGQSSRIRYYTRARYNPGIDGDFFGNAGDCAATESGWEALSTELRRPSGGGPRVVFRYRGRHEDEFCPLPAIRVVCDGKPLTNGLGTEETDDGTRFEVRRVGPDEWSATFFPTESESGKGRKACAIQVLRTSGAPVSSGAFSP